MTCTVWCSSQIWPNVVYFSIWSPLRSTYMYMSSISVAALGFLWYKSSHPDPRKSPQLQIYYLIIDPILLPSQVVFYVGEQKIVRWCQIRRIWRVINQLQATVVHSSHCNHRALSWWKRIPFVSFSGHLRNVSSSSFQSPELIIQCGFVYKKTMQLVSGKVELMNAKFHCCGTIPS